MERLVQKINFGYVDMYVYGEADFETNNAMQEPLKKLYGFGCETHSCICRESGKKKSFTIYGFSCTIYFEICVAGKV